MFKVDSPMGRWVIAMHARYCRPKWIPVLWVGVIILGVLQVLLVARVRP